jgi:hypothetical protein
MNRCECCNKTYCPEQRAERDSTYTDDVRTDEWYQAQLAPADADAKALCHLQREQTRLDHIVDDDDELCVLDPEEDKPSLRPLKTRMPLERTRAGYKALAKPKKFHTEAKRGDKTGNSAKSAKNRKKQFVVV